MRTEFKLNEEEVKKIKQFQEKHHKNSCDVFYCFRPVPGFGYSVFVFCKTCNIMEDVTNYDLF